MAQTRLIGALAALLSLSLIGERGRGGEVCYTGEAAFRSHKIVCANDSCGYAELLQCCFALLFLGTDKPNTQKQVPAGQSRTPSPLREARTSLNNKLRSFLGGSSRRQAARLPDASPVLPLNVRVGRQRQPIGIGGDAHRDRH